MRKTERKKVLRSRRAAELLTFSTTREIKEGEKIKKKSAHHCDIRNILLCNAIFPRAKNFTRVTRDA